MLKKLQKTNKGFTIVEVMIVLAIAGLIILVVLLAVPALQRNSRNTSIKNDASAVVSSIGEFTSTNDGRMPNAVTSPAGSTTLTLAGGAGSTTTTGKVQGSTIVATSLVAPTDPGTINVALQRKCNDTGTGLAAGTNSRSASVLYLQETTTTTTLRCLDS
jgi:prepilin-type N-terminal cleavage/methylation domain-containing protein